MEFQIILMPVSGSELHELQLLIDHLDISSDPAQVCQLLMLRRDVMFLEYDTAVRHAMRDTFLATKNTAAYNVSLPQCVIVTQLKLYYSIQ